MTDKKNLYEDYPEVFACLKIEGEKMIFDFNESKVSAPEIMVILNTTINEYLKTVAQEYINQQNLQETNKGEKNG